MRPVTYSWLAIVIAVACAAIGWLGIAGWLAVVVAAACVAMHVAGNAIGTRLREATDSDLRRRRPAARQPAMPAPRPTLLERKSDLGRLVLVSAAIGGICGGVAGSAALLLLAASSPAGAVLGGVSSAVIGAILGFLGASFVEIVRTSLQEAVAAERRA
jgi:hypothetical protein